MGAPATAAAAACATELVSDDGMHIFSELHIVLFSDRTHWSSLICDDNNFRKTSSTNYIRFAFYGWYARGKGRRETLVMPRQSSTLKTLFLLFLEPGTIRANRRMGSLSEALSASKWLINSKQEN